MSEHLHRLQCLLDDDDRDLSEKDREAVRWAVQILQADAASSEVTESWLQEYGATRFGKGWLFNNENSPSQLPVLFYRSDTRPSVWVAEIDGHYWPVDIRSQSQVLGLLRETQR